MELFDDLDRDILRGGITLINYDRVWTHKIEKVWNRKKGRYENKRIAVIRPEIDKEYGCIVLDEAHYIKNHTSNRSQILLKLACRASYRYILTGTPVSNGQLENFYSLFTFLDPYLERGLVCSRIFGGSYQKFKDRYCILNMYHKPSSYIHVKELQEIIGEHSYRVKKVECLDLPEKLPDEIVKVDLLEKRLYNKLATKSAILEYEILAENPLSRLVKLRQMSSGFLTYREKNEEKLLELKSEKLNALEEILEGYPDDKKVVIFAEFKRSIENISSLLRKMKIRFVVLDGDQKDKTIWRKFQADPKIRVIVCQYKTANAGIDLYASDTIIYYEPTLSSNVLEQSRDRIHRTGQKEKCSYIHLLTRGTVEVDIYRALAGYSDFSEALFTRYIEGYRRNYNA